tara:strand:+ start:956 stop:1339 length:384 start_codon:yes stop_codon:yes gene_type:complete
MSLIVTNINSTTATVIEGVTSFEKVHITNVGSVDAVFTLRYIAIKYTPAYTDDIASSTTNITSNIIKDVVIPVGTALELDGFVVNTLQESAIVGEEYTEYFTNVQLEAFIGTSGQTVDLLIQLNYDQ